MNLIRSIAIATIIGFIEVAPAWARHRLTNLNSKQRDRAQQTMLFHHDTSFYLY